MVATVHAVVMACANATVVLVVRIAQDPDVQEIVWAMVSVIQMVPMAVVSVHAMQHMVEMIVVPKFVEHLNVAMVIVWLVVVIVNPGIRGTVAIFKSVLKIHWAIRVQAKVCVSTVRASAKRVFMAWSVPQMCWGCAPITVPTMVRAQQRVAIVTQVTVVWDVILLFVLVIVHNTVCVRMALAIVMQDGSMTIVLRPTVL